MFFTRRDAIVNLKLFLKLGRPPGPLKEYQFVPTFTGPAPNKMFEFTP